MKKVLYTIVGVLLLTAHFSPFTASAYVSPGSPTGYVNDFAHVLSVDTKQTLEQQLVQFHTDTTNEVVVAIVPTLGDDYIESYTLSLAEDWKIADAKKDNAVILLLAVNDRKIRIEVGYGLEGALPDSVANSIIREITPSLKAEDYNTAVSTAVAKIIAATKDEYVAESTSQSTSGGSSGLFEVLFLFGVFVLQWLASVLGRSKAWWPGGVIGFGAGSALALWNPFGFALLAYALIIGLFTVFGAFFDYVVSNTFEHDNRHGYDHPWWIGGGSGSSWGGSGGFGGFGGGGGGSFGGGGSSGSW